MTCARKGYKLVPVSRAGRADARSGDAAGAGDVRFARLVSLPVFMTLSWLGHLLTGVVLRGDLARRGADRVPERRRLGAIGAPRRAGCRRALPEPPPLQTVLIPAHNEAKVIVGAVRHVLASDYREL